MEIMNWFKKEKVIKCLLDTSQGYRCSYCIDTGQKSTLVFSHWIHQYFANRYYDEQGKWHSHSDPKASVYQCSNKHLVYIIERGSDCCDFTETTIKQLGLVKRGI